MRPLISVLLAAVVLMLPLSVIAAPSLQASIDVKALAIVRADLPSGFEVVPDRTVSDDRADGVAVYDVTFARDRSPANLSAGPFEVRSGVARTAQVDDATLQFESTKEAFVGEGWTETGVPQLGDEAVGLTQTTDGDGGKIAHFSYLFRKQTYIMMIGVRGRPEATRLNDAVSLAIIVSGRLDKALSGGAPSAPSGPGGATTGQATGEKVRVINADGGSVNMRAEPSTSASVVTQVAEGTTLDVIGPNREAEGRTWRNVKTPDNKEGWIASTLLETIAAPPTAPPSPSPGPVRTATPSPETDAPSDPQVGATPTTEPSVAPSASPSASASATPEASGGVNTFRGSGNGLEIEGIIRDLNLQAGKQQIKVRVTRNGGGVQGAFVDVMARLDPRRYRSIKADNTNNDGWTEVEIDMEGAPPGTYEVVVEAKPTIDGQVTSAKSSFKWKQ
jgi:hypothetical protein